MTLSDLKSKFLEIYGSSPHDIHCFQGPGRVNLMGDHTDYNGGLVFPCGVDRGITLLLRFSQGRDLSLRSLNADWTVEGPLSQLQPCQQWTDYPLGVMRQLEERGAKFQGMQCLYYGDLPQGAGLSSSAAIEVVTAFGLNHIYQLNLDLIELVRLSQAAERDFVGVNCGIMDQFAVAFAQENCGIRLNCQSLEYSIVPLPLEQHQLVIINSMTPRQLTHSAYNQRAMECRQSLDYFRHRLGVSSLVDMSNQEFEANQLDLDPCLRRRARHVITEHNRVIAGVDALEAGDLETFGRLMVESHQSLRDDFEVSTECLDFLVERALAVPGTLGSRLSGAGFGGCTVNLVAVNQVDEFCQRVGDEYQAAFGKPGEFYKIAVAGGVRAL